MWSEPGPGFLPLAAGTAMAIVLFVGSFREKSAGMPPFFPKADSWKRVVATFASLGVYALILDYVCFTLTTFLFVAFLVKFIFPQIWTKALIVALLAAIGSRLLFVDLLKTQGPKRFLGF
jgi:hypothetical protein